MNATMHLVKNKLKQYETESPHLHPRPSNCEPTIVNAISILPEWSSACQNTKGVPVPLVCCWGVWVGLFSLSKPYVPLFESIHTDLPLSFPTAAFYSELNNDLFPRAWLRGGRLPSAGITVRRSAIVPGGSTSGSGTSGTRGRASQLVTGLPPRPPWRLCWCQFTKAWPLPGPQPPTLPNSRDAALLGPCGRDGWHFHLWVPVPGSESATQQSGARH